ncbi:enoyl-CoA hydratase/isomerase family protein [Actinoallomurus soli]|uniref:enoyl-CoA hydratase/isomerase family protein n=1 Tax=Actinoallomurus soli TaxID=2952535 RepID=UPI0020920EB6|nr:enoyl-CoA hydratase/isomerase family protein [Actinoallomurus soli]MCO5971118.1 enoyl-CoA hydratase/isomerase family protein [Actinoallomurus soli]
MKIRTQRDVEVAEITVGDGRRGNALASADWRELEQTFRRLALDAELRVVVVRGQGGMFSSGSDVREWVEADVTDVADSFAAMEAALTAIEDLPVPVIAQVEGVAAGAGCQLALACDLQVMAESARIGMPIARLGILVSPAFAARLVVLAGPGVARELLYTGRLVSAAEAMRLGLATRCVPDAELATATRRLVLGITRHPDAAVRAAKHAVGAVLTPAWAAAKAQAGGPPVAFEDFQRGIATFLRDPRATSP